MNNFESAAQDYIAGLYCLARHYAEAFGNGPLADVAAADQEFAAKASRQERESRGLEA